MSLNYFLLAVRNFRIPVRPKFLFRERLRMVAMGVQGQHHRLAFLDDSYSRMTATVDAPLVAFRQAKPSFQIQVVARPIAAISARKQARFKTGHQASHVLTDGIRVRQ